MVYSINPQVQQDSIAEFLRTQYPDMAVIEDGLPADDNEELKPYNDGLQQSFILLWFSNPRQGSKKGFGGRKLDSYIGTVDVSVIATSGTRARRVMNHVSDQLIDFKPTDGGRLSQGRALFGDTRQIKQEANRPERWMRTNRFDFGVAARKVA